MRVCNCPTTTVTIELTVPLPCLHEVQQTERPQMLTARSGANSESVCDGCYSKMRAADDGWRMDEEESSDCDCAQVNPKA
jgi:hypothetical protein